MSINNNSKNLKFKKRNSCLINNAAVFQWKNNMDSKNKMGNLKRLKYKTSLNLLNWKNDLKNKEIISEEEYNHIGEDLRQSLIHFDKKFLEDELKSIENTETTNLINRLPSIKNESSCFSPNGRSIVNNKNITIEASTQSLSKRREKLRLLQHTGYVYDSLDDEEIEDEIYINNYYISPHSTFIYVFDSILAILSFFCLFYIPYYLAHDTFLISSLDLKIFLFFFVDIFYIIDLVISFFRAYYDYDEILKTFISDMCYHYINTYFLVDLFSAIPFYSIFFLMELQDDNKMHIPSYSHGYFDIKINKMHYIFITNKLLKIFKTFSKTNKAILKFLNKIFKNDIIEEKSGIIFVVFILISMSNFGTCLFIFTGRNSYPSWMHNLGIESKPFWNIYICSLYYLIATITTVGYGDIHCKSYKEIIFQMILLIIGTCTYSYLISLVSNYIKKMNEESLHFEKRLKILNDIKISNPHLTEQLYEKLLRFLRYKKNTEKMKQALIINSLPYSLKNSLIIEM